MNVLSSPFQRVCNASSKSRPLFQKFPIHHNKGLKTTYNNINNNHINLRFFSNSTSSTTAPSPTSLAYSRSFAYQKNGNRGSWNWSSWTRGRTGWKGASVVSTIGLGGIAVSLATYSRPAVLCEGSHLPSPTRTTFLFYFFYLRPFFSSSSHKIRILIPTIIPGIPSRSSSPSLSSSIISKAIRARVWSNHRNMCWRLHKEGSKSTGFHSRRCFRHSSSKLISVQHQ